MRILTESDKLVKKLLRIRQKVLLLSFLQMFPKSIILVKYNNGFKNEQLKNSNYYSLFHIASFIVTHIMELIVYPNLNQILSVSVKQNYHKNFGKKRNSRAPYCAICTQIALFFFLMKQILPINFKAISSTSNRDHLIPKVPENV